MSWEEEPGRLAAVCERAGCKLARVLSSGLGEPPGWLAECPDRWATVRLLDELAWEDAHDPPFVEFARELEGRAYARSKFGFFWLGVAEFFLEWVQDHVKFVDEPIETFIGWREVLKGGGDCDDMARLLVALLRAIDGQARLATILDAEREPAHVAAQMWAGEWQWLEATVRGARVGEHPAEACRRLGIPVRPDLGG